MSASGDAEILLSGLVVMPLRQYFGGVGGILLAALLAANIGLSASSAQLRAEVPLNEIFNLQIHSSHKWPDKVVLVVAEHQPLPVAETRRKQHATSTRLSIQNSQTPRDAFAALNDPSADAPADYIAAQ